MVDNPLYTFLILICNLIKLMIKSVMETAYKSSLLLTMFIILMRFQEHCTKCRRKCKCIKRRNHDRNSHRNTKLTIECSRSSTHERYRHKHSRHYQCD